MRLAELAGQHDFRIIEVAPPRAPGEVLLDVAVCGVCASELDTWEGRSEGGFPRRIGHEVSGTVVEADEGSAHAVGDPGEYPARANRPPDGVRIALDLIRDIVDNELVRVGRIDAARSAGLE